VDPIIILNAGVASGTVLLFATIGEIFSERSGVLNLGVEGMMLIGAMSAYSVALSTGSPWLGVLAAALMAGLLSQVHALITIQFQADQVVSGLALTFLGTGLSLVFGEGLSKAGAVSLLPTLTVPGLSAIPVLGPILFDGQSVMVYLGYLLIPLAWFIIYRTRPGMHLRAVGEFPAAADALGINVARLRYLYVFVGGTLAGLSGATISLAVSPGWFSHLTGLDRHRPGDLRSVGSAAGRVGLLRLRSPAPAHPGHSGPDRHLRPAQPLLLQPLLGLLPTNAPVCLHHRGAGDRLARGNPQAPGRAGRAGSSVHPWRTWPLSRATFGATAAADAVPNTLRDR
jgi:ABC-type uncharacterized transport system permease subunit